MKKALFITALLFVGLGLVSEAQNGYKIGDKADDFSLKGVDGKNHSMSDYSEAKGFIIVFTCNHCPYSVAYEDRIIELQNNYGPKGFQVIAINPNDPISYPSDGYEPMIERAKEKGFNFPYLVDEGQALYPKYGATRTPHIFILDNERTVKYIGAIDNATTEKKVTEKFAENALNALLEGNDPEVAETKAIGCSIKAKK